MAISFACASCGKAYEVGNELAGKKGKCACGAVFQVPAASAPQPPPRPQPAAPQRPAVPQQPARPPQPQQPQVGPPAGGAPQQPARFQQPQGTPPAGVPPQPQVPAPQPLPGQVPGQPPTPPQPQMPAPQPLPGGNPLQPLSPMGGAGQPGMPQQGMPGQVQMGGMPQQGMPGQMPMGGIPQQGMPQQGMPGQMPMGGMPQQGMPGQMPMGGNAYAAPQAMGAPRAVRGGPVNTAMARASGHMHFFNAAVIGAVCILTLLIALFGAVLGPSSPRAAGSSGGFVEFLGRMLIIFMFIVGVVFFLAPLVSITAQWMFMTIPSHAGKVLAIVAACLSTFVYLVFVILVLTGNPPAPVVGFLLFLVMIGWWVVHHLSLWKCAATYRDTEGAKSAIISCIVFPAGAILWIILIMVIGAFTDLAIGSISSPRDFASAGKGIAILMILYLLAYTSLTTFFYCKTMNSIRRNVR